MANSINLFDRTQGGKIRNLSGKEPGEAAREYFELDKRDGERDSIVVIVPEDVYSLGPSFFCGMFGESYSKLGPIGLLQHRIEKSQ